MSPFRRGILVPPMLSLEADLQYLKGVGPKRAEALLEKGVATVEDLLFWLPFRYEDRGHPQQLRAAHEGEVITARARVLQSQVQDTRRRNFSILRVLLDDGSGSIRAVLFNKSYLAKTLAPGAEGIFHGRVTRDRISGGIQLDNPDFEIVQPGDEAEWHRIVPIHPRLPGFTPRQLRRLLRRVLDELPASLDDALPAGVAERMGLGPRKQAFEDVHFPPEGAPIQQWQRQAAPCHQRLIVEELFAMQAAFLLRRRLVGPRTQAHAYLTSPEVGDRLRELLPFRLTQGQRTAFREIVADLKRPVPMARLLQGDVGSGKTIVALLAMLLAAESGFQAALMAPTELLAEQHARSFRDLLGLSRDVGLLTGSIGVKERRAMRQRLADGQLSLVVGTHALFQDTVRFKDLALVVIDEQHRFGIEQRERLVRKGDSPDVLVMTATPIPRTLALSLHGDLDVSIIPDKPPGRRPVKTAVREETARPKVQAFLKKQVAAGRQAYVVHPVIDESEDDDVRAAVEGWQRLQRELPGARVGLVHGRMKPEERERTMRLFAGRDVDVLVATTVIEVGIDVPNATVMIVEAAPRFWLSQLHQLRGRVGRGAHDSWCILFRGASPTPDGDERLRLMESTEDGFLLAEADLRQRGAGHLFGARQAGSRDLRIADPLRDTELLLAARAEAEAWLRSMSEADLGRDPLLKTIARRWAVAADKSAAG